MKHTNISLKTFIRKPLYQKGETGCSLQMQECLFVLSGILVFADKIIDSETSRHVKEWIRMTKVGKLYEQEKIEYANRKCADEIIDMGREDGKSDEEIISRLKKRLGYDDIMAAEAVASYDRCRAVSVITSKNK